MRITRVIGALAALSLACGCGGEASSSGGARELSQGLTYEQFRDELAVYEPEYGVYVANGDEAFEGEAALREFYEASIKPGALAIYRTSTGDVKWSASQALSLSYCVSTKFGANYTRVVNAMASATAEWEATAGINYVHLSQYDGSCTNRQSAVVFDVNPVSSGGQYLARAFFPNASRRSRNVLIDGSSFGNISPWTLTGVLRHELGHTLGFRHEHTRPEAGTCFEDNQWRALTPYDSSSVMHYPQCNGTQSGDLVLTSSDKSGARSAYP
ncbi:MAG TPA: M57 family metalloprotease [Aggregicoccus sp.]|nr:M57 family metalloprotease [Aggregicoccus sp.]